jgi:hypothetical protein
MKKPFIKLNNIYPYIVLGLFCFIVLFSIYTLNKIKNLTSKICEQGEVIETLRKEVFTVEPVIESVVEGYLYTRKEVSIQFKFDELSRHFGLLEDYLKVKYIPKSQTIEEAKYQKRKPAQNDITLEDITFHQ